MATGILIIYAITVTAVVLWQVHGAKGSGVAHTSMPAARIATPEQCPDAHVGISFYRGRYVDWRSARKVDTRYPVGRKPRNCADAHYLAEVWPDRSFQERLITEKWIEEHTLRDFEFRPGNHAWHKAVREVQKVFPGTESWLLSCSDVEGGHGRWVGYSGVAYSTQLRDSDTVGGPMQYRFSTFTGHIRHAFDYLTEKLYRVPKTLRDRTAAWRSALGQALAAGWARYFGEDNSHWSANWGNGC